MVLNAVWTTIAGFFQHATLAMLTGTITLLLASPWPDLTVPWYRLLWGSAFGLVILVSIAVLVIHAIWTALTPKDTSLGVAFIGLLKNFGIGAFLPLVIFACMLVSTEIVLVINILVTSLVGTNDWSSILQPQYNFTANDAVAQFLVFNVVATNSTIMYIQAIVAGGAVMIYMIWYLLAGAVGFGFIGKVIRAMLLGMLFTMLFQKVVQVTLLGTGAIVMKLGAGNFTATALAILAAACTFAAICAPPVMFVVLTVQFYKHERNLDPKIIMQRMNSQYSRAQSTQQLNSERAATAARASEKAKEFGREVVRTAAVAATVAGIAKVTAMILAKIPTPQTRLAALGVAGIGVVSKAVQNKASQSVSDRIGRVGRPRTAPSGR